MKNRVGITVRFNHEEQENLRSLTKFWGMDAKKVLKLGFDQLVTSTKQLQDKLIEREKVANEEQSETTQSGDSSSSDQLAGGHNAPRVDRGDTSPESGADAAT